MKKQHKLKTCPELSDAAWLDHLAQQPENRGIDVQLLFDRMIKWCSAKGQSPTRRRLLIWLADERAAMPLAPPQKPAAAKQSPATPVYRCSACLDMGWLMVPKPGGRVWEMIEQACTACTDPGTDQS